MTAIRKLVFCVALGSITAITPALSQNYLPLDQIFFPSPKYEVIEGVHLVAYFEDGDFASYLLKRSDTGELLLLKNNDAFQFAEYRLTFIGVHDGQLLFSSEGNQNFVLDIGEKNNPSPTVSDRAKPSVPSVSRAPEEKVQFTQAKELARILGAPNILVNSFDVMPDYGFSRGGRKGLLLGEGVPKLFFTFTPFKRGDILLGPRAMTWLSMVGTNIQRVGVGKLFAVNLFTLAVLLKTPNSLDVIKHLMTQMRAQDKSEQQMTLRTTRLQQISTMVMLFQEA